MNWLAQKYYLGNGVLSVIRNNKDFSINVPGTILNDLSDYGIAEFVKPRVKFAIDLVSPGSGAQKAGLAKGDSIVAVNGQQDCLFRSRCNRHCKTIRISR